MFYFHVLAEFTLLWWIGMILLLPVTLVIALHAHKDRFSVCVVLSLVGAALVHALGLVDLVHLAITAWPWLLGGLAVYLTLSFPYARFVEWRRYLANTYKKRNAQEQEQLTAFSKSTFNEWFPSRWNRELEKLVDTDPSLKRNSHDFDHRRYEEAQRNFRRSPETTKAWEEYQKSSEFLSKWQSALDESGLRKPIRASQHKALIVGWMVFWPYKLMYRVVVQWVLEFFERIKDLFRMIVERFMHLLQRDADRAFEKYVNTRKEETPHDGK